MQKNVRSEYTAVANKNRFMFMDCPMRRMLFVGLGLFLLLIGSALTNRTLGQEPATVVSEETYYKVLDLVFPRNVLDRRKLRYAFVLRYEPTFQAESQIVIAEQGEEIEVVKYTSLNGNIDLKLDEMLRRTGIEDPEQMAKQIRIQKQHIKLSRADIRLLHKEFFDHLRLSEKTRLGAMPDTVIVTADGTRYRLWYSGIVDIQSGFLGSGINAPTRSDEPPLMEWMKAVYRKFATASEHTHR